MNVVWVSTVMDQLGRSAGGLASIMVLYVGPDQILPLTSFLGALIGLLLMFWRYVVGLMSKVWQFFVREH